MGSLNMIAVLQRVKKAEVRVGLKIIGRIKKGILVFLGIGKADSKEDANYLAKKIGELRIFEDSIGKMNLSIQEVKGEFLVVSQFTLLGDCQDGRRPSFDKAAQPKSAESLYEYFVEQLKKYSLPVATGEFRALMEVDLVNYGPVTFILDSRDV